MFTKANYMTQKSKFKAYPLKMDEKDMEDLKKIAPKYGHGNLASFIRWILINFKNNHKD